MVSGSRIARKEVSEWLKNQAVDGDRGDRVEIDSVNEEERRIVLRAMGGQIFSITYQRDYPFSDEEHLFVETECKVGGFVAVVNDLRDFVYGQPTSLTLTALLDQLKKYLTKACVSTNMKGTALASDVGARKDRTGRGDDQSGAKVQNGDAHVTGAGDETGDDSRGRFSEAAEEGSNEGDESDYVYEDDEEEAGGIPGNGNDIEMMTSWLDEHYKKRKWQEKERQLRKEMSAKHEKHAEEQQLMDARSSKQDVNKVENIFTSKASSAVLTQDLLEIQRLERELGMTVDAVGDNIFHWKVKIHRLSASSPLCEDLQQLRSRFSYGYVEMELVFTMDLYPFYPPLVKLVRPRFEGFVMGRISSLEMLQLSKWCSVRGMRSVLIGIRTALETWGRLDLDSDLNDAVIHPEGSYTELEHLLMRLGLVTEMRSYTDTGTVPSRDVDNTAEDRVAETFSEESADGNETESSVERKRKRASTAGIPEWESVGDVGSDRATIAYEAEFSQCLISTLSTGPEADRVMEVDTTVGSLHDTVPEPCMPPELTTQSVSADLIGSEYLGTGTESGSSPASTSAHPTGTTVKKDPASTGGGGKQYWAAGTGYGHSGASGQRWDVEAFLAAQREQDRLKENLLQEIAYLLRPDETELIAAQRQETTRNESYRLRADDDCMSVVNADQSGNLATTITACARDAMAEGHLADVPLDGGTAGGGNEGEGIGDTLPKRGDKGKGKVDGLATATKGGGAHAAHRASQATLPRQPLSLAQEKIRVLRVQGSLRVLEESCLVPFLQQLLENDSLLDVHRHASLYSAVFKVVQCLTSWKSLRPLLYPMKDQSRAKSIHRLMGLLRQRVHIYRKTISKGTADRKSQGSNVGEHASHSAAAESGGKSSMGTRLSPEDLDQGTSIDFLLAVARDVEDAIDRSVVEDLERAQTSGLAEEEGSAKRGQIKFENASFNGIRERDSKKRVDNFIVTGRIHSRERENEWAQYRDVMKPMQYMEVSHFEHFTYQKESESWTFRGIPQRVKRLGQEHADLSQSLPLSLSSSVFVRTHEDQMDWMQVMISGPDDTPYSGGLFAFDIFFPHNYPETPPLVKLVTTGGGRHRFNPNLYADGKVCLSLLGTWDGDRAETWNANTSTLLQVLVSIQSLIFVPEPYFNEPGYERQLGTPEGDKQSWAYNARQREGTLRLAILGMLERPPQGFEEVVRHHFFLRRRHLERLMRGYLEEGRNRAGPSAHKAESAHVNALERLVEKVTPLLAELQPPSSTSSTSS